MNEFRIRPFRPAQALEWLACGWRLWRRAPLEALVPAATFALAALLLRAIPVIGDVVLLLLLPSVAASYLIHVDILARTAATHRPSRGRGRALLEHWLRALRQALFGAWGNAQNVFPLFLVGFVLVVLGLIAHALFAAVGGQAVVSPYRFFELSGEQMLRLLLAYGVTGVFWFGVAALLQWTLPLFVIRDVALVGALALNLRALQRNAAIAALHLLLLAALFLPAAMLRLWSPLASVVALWALTTVVATLFGVSGYCSFRLVFAEAAPPAAAAAPGRS